MGANPVLAPSPFIASNPYDTAPAWWTSYRSVVDLWRCPVSTGLPFLGRRLIIPAMCAFISKYFLA